MTKSTPVSLDTLPQHGALVPPPKHDNEPPSRTVVPTVILDVRAPDTASPEPEARVRNRPIASTVKLSVEEHRSIRSATVSMAPAERIRPDSARTPTSARDAAPAPPHAPDAASRVTKAPAAEIRDEGSTRAHVSPRHRILRRRALVATAVGGLVLVAACCVVVAAAIAQDKRWLAPTLLSSSDARVLQVAATLQQETARKNELLLEKTELEARIREAKRWESLEETFQASFKATLRADLDARRAELRRIQGLLVAEYAADDAEVTKRSSELETRLGALRQRIRLLEDASRDGRDGTYDSLALRREYDRSLVGLERTRELEGALVKALATVDEALAQKTALLSSIESSPYRLAIAGDATLGFVPYENLADVKRGEPLFACRAARLLCRRVGEVGELVPGEVRGAHPSSGRELRGQLVRLALTDPRSVERPVLYVRSSL